MAQAGFTPISLYFSSTAAAVPTSGNLANGELALNIADMKLYAKNSSGVVTLLASNAATTPTTPGGSTTQVQFNSSGTFAGSANMTFNGTTLTVADLTDSSLTANRVVYAGTAGNLTTSANLAFNGSQLTALYGTSSGASYGVNQPIRIDANVNTGYAIGIPSTGGVVGGYYVNGGANTYDGGIEYSGTDRYLYLRSAGTNFVVVNNLGNVGIGSVASVPAYALDVRVAASNSIRAGSSANSFGSLLEWNNASGFGRVGSLGGYPFDLGTNGTTRFRIGDAGQFGIGGATYGTAGQVLTSGGSGSAPTWATAASGAQAFVAFGTTGESVFACGF